MIVRWESGRNNLRCPQGRNRMFMGSGCAGGRAVAVPRGVKEFERRCGLD